MSSTLKYCVWPKRTNFEKRKKKPPNSFNAKKVYILSTANFYFTNSAHLQQKVVNILSVCWCAWNTSFELYQALSFSLCSGAHFTQFTHFTEQIRLHAQLPSHSSQENLIKCNKMMPKNDIKEASQHLPKQFGISL